MIPLYQEACSLSLNSIPSVRPLDHTMSKSLDAYVRQRLPEEAIEAIFLKDGSIEIHGIYPTHADRMLSTFPVDKWVEVPCNFKPIRADNFIRPRFFIGDGTKLYVFVTPGREYLLHYGTLLRHLGQLYSEQAKERTNITYYTNAEEFLARWTGLDEQFVKSNDRVIIGHVQPLRDLFEELSCEPISSHANDFYNCSRYRLPSGEILNLLSVSYCYWGTLGERVVAQLCALGAAEIIYIGKLGTLSSPADIYERVFCPSSFVVMEQDRILSRIDSVPNGILQTMPHIGTGLHVSVATILEEDYGQREVTSGIGAKSIDNEISKMARCVFRQHQDTGKTIRFSAVHFATDYLRLPEERHILSPFDLSNNRQRPALMRKHFILQKMLVDIILPYVGLNC